MKWQLYKEFILIFFRFILFKYGGEKWFKWFIKRRIRWKFFRFGFFSRLSTSSIFISSSLIISITTTSSAPETSAATLAAGNLSAVTLKTLASGTLESKISIKANPSKQSSSSEITNLSQFHSSITFFL